MDRLARLTGSGARSVALLVALVLLGVVALAGCGHAFEALVHHRSLWCAFHGWRAYHDLKHQHPGWTLYQLWRAAHSCL